jgi:hypothetical protein
MLNKFLYLLLYDCICLLTILDLLIRILFLFGEAAGSLHKAFVVFPLSIYTYHFNSCVALGLDKNFVDILLICFVVRDDSWDHTQKLDRCET